MGRESGVFVYLEDRFYHLTVHSVCVVNMVIKLHIIIIFNIFESYYDNIIDGGDDMRVANVSAWGRQTSSAPNQQIREIVSGVSPRRDEKGGIVDLWSSANTELEAKQKREQERKIDVSDFLLTRTINNAIFRILPF